MSKIVKLTSENIKRIHAVEISPSGNLVVIGGKNGQGKSSVLDSIEYALGGEPSDTMPVRRGEDSGKVVVDLGDLVVRRTFTAAGGSSLVVTNADGIKQGTPQAILDKLVGKLAFDPLDFSRQKPARQAEILRGIVGLDFTAHDAERQVFFDARTALNRDVKNLESQISALPATEPGLPAEETSTLSVLTAQHEATKALEENKAIRAEVEVTERNLVSFVSRKDQLEKDLVGLQNLISRTSKSIDNLQEVLTTQKTAASKLVDPDMTQFPIQLADLETTNQKIRTANIRANVVTRYKTKTEEVFGLTAKLAQLDAEKVKKISEAKYPIEGLRFDAGVTLNDIPFEQCSSADKLKVSIAVGIALNPKLKILLIREGAFLDEDSFALVKSISEKEDVQIWLEQVGSGAQTSVVIEDGGVA